MRMDEYGIWMIIDTDFSTMFDKIPIKESIYSRGITLNDIRPAQGGVLTLGTFAMVRWTKSVSKYDEDEVLKMTSYVGVARKDYEIKLDNIIKQNPNQNLIDLTIRLAVEKALRLPKDDLDACSSKFLFHANAYLKHRGLYENN